MSADQPLRRLTPAGRPDRLILVYNGDSGLRAMLVDVLKKAAGREDCSLCEITYSAVGKRNAWKECEKRLGMIVDELHRNDIPVGWGIARSQLPCVLARVGEMKPFVLLSREAIDRCGGRIERLEQRIVEALDAVDEIQPAAETPPADVSHASEAQSESERRSM